MAIEIASEKMPANIKSISQIADGINHAVPTEKEMQDSIKWLLNKNLISKNDKKYSLTDLGYRLSSQSKKNTPSLIEICNNLKTTIQNYEKKL